MTPVPSMTAEEAEAFYAPKHISGYQVTADGAVYSCDHNWRGYGRRELAQQPNDDGYPSVRLTVDGKRTRMAVHRLVAETFLGPRPTPAHEVRHLNGDKTDNRLSNLAWGTRAENAADREDHGRTSRGAKHSASIKASNHAEAVRAFRASAKALGA